MVKNRDYHPTTGLCNAWRESSLHAVIHSLPTSAGSPLFSVQASTVRIGGRGHICSFHRCWTGIARYSLEMDILQNMATVQEAIDYLPTRPHFGDGTLTLIDSQGNMRLSRLLTRAGSAAVR
jgi:hypothetical protein